MKKRRAGQETRPYNVSGGSQQNRTAGGASPSPTGWRGSIPWWRIGGRADGPQHKAQRSGFALERRSDGMSELCPSGRSEGYGIRDAEGPPLRHLRRDTEKPAGGRAATRGRPYKKTTKTTATFLGTLQQYFIKTRLCNNYDAMLRFCYTSPKPVDGGLVLEYSMSTGKGSYAPTEWVFYLIIGILHLIFGKCTPISGRE